MTTPYSAIVRDLRDLRGSYHLFEEQYGIAAAARRRWELHDWYLVEGEVVNIRDATAMAAARAALEEQGCREVDILPAKTFGLWQWWGAKQGKEEAGQ